MDKFPEKVLLFIAIDWYFVSHRLSLAAALSYQGYDVTVVTRIDKHPELLERDDFSVIDLSIHRSRTNILLEFLTLARICKIYMKVKPDVVHHVALKPIIYGTIAAIACRVPIVINAIAGFGTVFSTDSKHSSLFRWFVRKLLHLALKKSSSILVQNTDDFNAVKDQFGADENKIFLLHGAGVDLDVMQHTNPGRKTALIISIVSRMLWTKGIADVIKAAKLSKNIGLPVTFWLVGEPDVENPRHIPTIKLEEWAKLSNVEWKGYRKDIAYIWKQSDIALLPSYTEGLPKALIEAAACGRPIITTDAPGCREMIIDGLNGILVPVNDPEAIVSAIQRLLENKEERLKMGEASRSIAEERFALSLILDKQINIHKRACPV